MRPSPLRVRNACNPGKHSHGVPIPSGKYSFFCTVTCPSRFSGLKLNFFTISRSHPVQNGVSGVYIRYHHRVRTISVSASHTRIWSKKHVFRKKTRENPRNSCEMLRICHKGWRLTLYSRAPAIFGPFLADFGPFLADFGPFWPILAQFGTI